MFIECMNDNLLILMGSICTNNLEKQQGTETVDTYKNSLHLQVTLGSNTSIDLILGHYKQNRCESLLAITELKNIQHCDPLKDYTSDSEKTIEIITSMRKTFCKTPVHKNCPYKKLMLCILPPYKTQQCVDYCQQFKNVLKEVFENTKELTIQFINTIEGIHNLPNQMLLAVLFQELMEIKTPFKLSLITTEKKMMNLYKYELLKTETCSIRYLNSD